MIFAQETYRDGALSGKEEWDSVALTYRSLDASGNVLESRALKPAERLVIQERAANAGIDANARFIHERAQAALTGNRTFLALPAYPASPTATQRDNAIRAIRQQVDALTRQMNGLIRLQLNQLDDTTDT